MRALCAAAQKAGHHVPGVAIWSMCSLQDRLDTHPDDLRDGEIRRRHFKIRCADSSSQARILINRMYAARGYQSTPLPDEQLPTRITLVASEHEVTTGTITIGFDSPDGLHLEDPFGTENAALRARGR